MIQVEVNMGPLEEIRKACLLELVNALRPFVGDDTPEAREAKRLVAIWEHAFKVWGWEKNDT
jgi:hypothetical protein